MKKLTILVMVIILLSSISAFGATVNIDLNGTPVQFTEQTGYPFIDSANRTQVPLRAVMEAYGCTVQWDQKTKTATIEKDGVNVTVPVGENYIYRNGNQVSNDTASVIIDERTYLPIRVVLESVGANVRWDGKNVIVNNNPTIYYKEFPSCLSIENVYPNIKFDRQYESSKRESTRSYPFGYYYQVEMSEELCKDYIENYANFLIDNGYQQIDREMFKYSFKIPDSKCDLGLKYIHMEDENNNYPLYLTIAFIYNNPDEYASSYDIQADKNYEEQLEKQRNSSISKVKTPLEFQSYLNSTYESFNVPMGTLDLKTEIWGSDPLSFSVHIDPTLSFINSFGSREFVVLDKIESDTRFTEEEREETLKIMKDISIKIIEDTSKAFPDSSVLGCYYSSWYDYYYLKIGYNNTQFMCWELKNGELRWFENEADYNEAWYQSVTP